MSLCSNAGIASLFCQVWLELAKVIAVFSKNFYYSPFGKRVVLPFPPQECFMLGHVVITATVQEKRFQTIINLFTPCRYLHHLKKKGPSHSP